MATPPKGRIHGHEISGIWLDETPLMPNGILGKDGWVPRLPISSDAPCADASIRIPTKVDGLRSDPIEVRWFEYRQHAITIRSKEQQAEDARQEAEASRFWGTW